MRFRFSSGARTCALLLAMLGACASTGETTTNEPDAGGSTVIPDVDGSTADGGIRVYEGGTRDADARIPEICSEDDFCHSAVVPGTHFRSVWGDGTGVLWAVTLEQDVLRWDGASWNVHYHSDSAISAIWGSGPTDLWVVAGTGLIRGTGDSSAQVTFAPVTSYLPGDQAASIQAVWGTGPLDVWAVGGASGGVNEPMRGRVLRYDDDPDLGLGWHLDSELSALPISFRGVHGTPATGDWLHGVARVAGTSTEPRVLHRPPGASTWNAITLPLPTDPIRRVVEISSVWTTPDGAVWLAGTMVSSGTVLFHGTSADGGATFDWELRDADALRPVSAMWGVGGNDLWAVGKTGLVKHWDGSTWSQAVTSVNDILVLQRFRAIWGTSNDDFWIVGDEIALHRTRGGKP